MYYTQILFQPIPTYLICFLLLAFPITITISELATYFGYIMPRLKSKLKLKFFALLLPISFLSIQHCTSPLVFVTKFILFRGLMYFPFAVMLGIALNNRPSLLPYLSILHGLFDTTTVIMLLSTTIDRL